MNRTAVSIALVLAGCATGDDMVQVRQPQAVDATLAAARRDLLCPGATAKVLSSHPIDPMMAHAPRYGGYGAPDRYSYEIAVEGCEKSRTYTTVCTEGQGCVVAPAKR
jgi:hypothetical protein